MVILDTCALIDLLQEKPNISPRVRKRITNGASILSVSFAEIACKIQLGKLELGMTPKALYYEYCEIPSIEIIDIGVEEWLSAIEMKWKNNKDPADRLITAFAKKHNLPIVTSDKKIKTHYKNVMW